MATRKDKHINAYDYGDDFMCQIVVELQRWKI